MLYLIVFIRIQDASFNFYFFYSILFMTHFVYGFSKHQRHVKDDVILPTSPKNKPHQVSSPEYSNQASPKFSRAGSEHRSERSIEEREEKQESGL